MPPARFTVVLQVHHRHGQIPGVLTDRQAEQGDLTFMRHFFCILCVICKQLLYNTNLKCWQYELVDEESDPLAHARERLEHARRHLLRRHLGLLATQVPASP